MKSHILVVDDDHSILELLRILLEGDGYQVHAFDSAAAALKAAITHPPDVAIVDLMMPGMNGLELIQALRYDARTRHVPVLICSAYYGDLRHITTNLKLQRTACLRKPFQIQDLLDGVARMLLDGHQPLPCKDDGVERGSRPPSNKDLVGPVATPAPPSASYTPSPVPIAALQASRRGTTRTERTANTFRSAEPTPARRRGRVR